MVKANKVIAFTVSMSILLGVAGCNKQEVSENTAPNTVVLEMKPEYYIEPVEGIKVSDLSKLVALSGENPLKDQCIKLEVPSADYSDKWCDYEFDCTLEEVVPNDIMVAEPPEEPSADTVYYAAIGNTDLLKQFQSATMADRGNESNDEGDSEINSDSEFVLWCSVKSVELLNNSESTDNQESASGSETVASEPQDQPESLEQVTQAEQAEMVQVTQGETSQGETVPQVGKDSLSENNINEVDLIPDEYKKHLVDKGKRYKVTIGSIYYIEESPEDFETTVDREIIEPMDLDELKEFMLEDAENRKEELAKEEERRQEEEHKAKLNSFTKQELATYIRSKEIDFKKMAPSSNANFVITDGKIMGLTDQGQQQEELVIGQYSIPTNSSFWEQLKKANKIKRLVFNGAYYTETKIMDEEDEKTKRQREIYGDEEVGPLPFHFEYGFGFQVPTNALKGCKSVEEIYLPDGISDIGEGAFAECENLRYVRMPEHCETLQGGIIANTKIVDLIMPYTITKSYSADVLKDAKDLVNLVFISHGAQSVGVLDDKQYIFKGCDKLERVAIDMTEALNAWNLKYSSEWFRGIVLITS